MPVAANSLSRALVGSPLRRPLVGCLFWIGLLVLLGIALLGHLLSWVIAPLPGSVVFLGTFALATFASIPALLVLWVLDRRERESIWIFGGAVIWGAIISTGLSAILNGLGFGFIALGLSVVEIDPAATGEFLTAALVAPPVEEAAKGLGVLLIFWFLRAEFDNLRDGLIYGALVGLGFNIAEVALYVMQGFLETGVAPIGQQFAARFVFLGLNTHLLWSALCGAGIGLARQSRRRWVQWLAPLGGYALATLGHALHNSIGVILLVMFLVLMGYDPAGAIPATSLWLAAALMNLLVQALPYLALLVLLALSARWERLVLRAYLADEVGAAVTPAEYSRIAGRIPWLGGHARANTRQARRIAGAQVELAFRKWHLDREDSDMHNDPLVAAWRADIARYRAEK